jgi:PAS domain-containing protein
MEKLLNVWYNTLPDGIVFLSTTQRDSNGAVDFRYQLVNKAFALFLEQDQDKLIGQSFESHFLPGHGQDLSIALRSVFESGISKQIDLVYTRETGDHVWLTIT